MPQPRNIRSSLVEKLLTDTMLSLLEREDFNNISVNDICAAASVSRSTFYLHFADKYNLAVRCVDEIHAAILETFDGDNLHSVFEQMLSEMYSRRLIYKNLLRYEGNGELKKRLNELFTSYSIRYYELSRSKGKQFDVPLEVVAVFFSAGMTGLVLWWINDNCDMPKEELLGHVARLHKCNPYI